MFISGKSHLKLALIMDREATLLACLPLLTQTPNRGLGHRTLSKFPSITKNRQVPRNIRIVLVLKRTSS